MPKKEDFAPLTNFLPPFAALRAFEAMHRLGGVRAAAESLSLHHAVVSRHIKHLEDWLGTSLVVRTSQKLTLTEESERYHARISAAIAEIALATRELAEGQQQRRLHVWCEPGLSIQWLSQHLDAFERKFPAHQLELKLSEVPANLHTHEADADIRYHRDSDPVGPGGKGLKVQILARPELMPVAAPALARKLGKIGALSEFLHLPLLHGGPDQAEWRDWLTLNGVDAPARLPGTICWHAHMGIAAARLSRGILLASRFLLQQDLESGSLVALDVPETVPAAIGGYVLTAREDRWSLPALVAVRRFLVDRM